MKVDFYTKVVLTVIAASQLYFIAKDVNLIQNAHAQSTGVMDVNIVKVDGQSLHNNALPIRFGETGKHFGRDAPIPVKIVP